MMKAPQTLYELTGAFAYLYELLGSDDEDYGDDTLFDTLDGLEGDIEDKFQGYGCVIRNIEADAQNLRKISETMQEEVARIKGKADAMEGRVKRMKDFMARSMQLIQRKNIKTPLFTFYTQTTQSTVIDDASKIPDIQTMVRGVPTDLLTKKEPVPNRTAIKAYIESNPDCDFAHIETSTGLRMR